MDRDFWIDKWETGVTGFHNAEPNRALIKYVDRLGLAPGARVFVPLCGKTRDIGWLAEQGFRVCGVELSELAVRALFEELGVVPERSERGALTWYGAPGIDIAVGDIFDLDRDALGPVEAIYDRAALVALPEGMRGRYAAHLKAMTGVVPQLLVCFEYDRTAMDGPPFSVDAAQVRRFYGAEYDLTLLARSAVQGGLKGRCAADRAIWLLERKDDG